MTLSNKRKAIVEELESKFSGEIIKLDKNSNIGKWLTQALNDYTQSIVEMLEGKELKISPYKDWIEAIWGKKRPDENIMRNAYQASSSQRKLYNQALNDIKEALNDTK